MIYARIPRHINLDRLVDSIKGNKTKKEFIRNGIVYIISRIHNEQSKWFQKQEVKNYDDYVILNYKILETIIGKGEWDRVSVIKKILLENDIIESDGIYYSKLKSYGYRLKREHISDDLVRYPLGDRISRAVEEILLQNKNEEDEVVDSDSVDDLEYLYQQFEKHTIRWSGDLITDLKWVFNNLVSEVSRKRELKDDLILSILNTCGILLRYVRDVNNHDYIYGISPSNNRFNTVLTTTPKVLRSYLRINDGNVFEVDMMTSQPYLLSTILNDEFENGDEYGYNLKTIYPLLKSDFALRRRIVQGHGIMNIDFFGWFFSEEQLESIREFCEIDFTLDFYQQVVEYGNFINIQLTREEVKKTIMNYLFNYNTNMRDFSDVITALDIRYKGMYFFIDGFHTFYKSKKLALLLQRVESFLVLKNVVPKILEYNDNIPIFTIHDCVLTTHEYYENVRDIMSETISSITHKPVGLKCHQLSQDVEKLMEYVRENSMFSKRKQLNESKKWWLKSSLLRGYSFIYPDGNDYVLDLINDFHPKFPRQDA